MSSALVLAGALSGCTPGTHTASSVSPPAGKIVPARQERLEFTDVAREAGIDFIHDAAASGRKYFVETMGSGVAFLDYDGDGRQDLLYLNGAPLPGYKGEKPLHPALYRNLGAGKFEEVTAKAGLAHPMYAMGVAVGDFDNDGDDDLYVTTVLGPSRLFRNDGGKFVDVAASAGVARPGSFPTSAAWLDYDKDGDLDLFVCNYVRYRSVADDLPCYFRQEIRSYCIPFAYKSEPDCLYRNQGNGTFQNVSKEAGIVDTDGKGLGVAIRDLNDDTWPDILVANDTTPTHAYLNQKDGRFQETATSLGIAFGLKGYAKAGMGIDAADDRNNGSTTIVMSNFSGEMLGLYRDTGDGLYQEESIQSGVGHPSAQLLGFGVFFFDYNNDGWQDLLVANGHVQDNVALFSEGVSYKQPPLLLRNDGDGRYSDVSRDAGPSFTRGIVARGAAFGDIDDDGRLDVAVNCNQGPAVLWRNTGSGDAHWLKLDLVGTRSNRNGYGARVALTSEAGVQVRECRSGSSYCSQSDQRLHFGLGSEATARRIEIRWPSGTVDVLTDVPADRTVTVREGSSSDSNSRQ